MTTPAPAEPEGPPDWLDRIRDVCSAVVTRWTLSCSTCHRGWTSPIAQGVCGRCGATVKARAEYQEIDLRGTT